MAIFSQKYKMIAICSEGGLPTPFTKSFKANKLFISQTKKFAFKRDRLYEWIVHTWPILQLDIT
jgi:hypothetical protein